MRFIVCAGTPGSGKTSVLLHVIKELKERKKTVSVVKIDCIQTDDERRFQRLNIPVKIGIAGDMCPDHYSIYNVDDAIKWADASNILIMETAGLCLRCSPYTKECLAICVIDTTMGPNAPLKIGPLMTTADIVVTTKGDLVSQAEREVFMERIYEVNPKCVVIEANGLSGKGAAEITDLILANKCDATPTMTLRHTPPLAICTLCTGEKRTNQKYHFGVLRNFEGLERYDGE
jgi:Ni2+-binding GTPase involved in maturation of urease and hydrogenase